MCVQGYAVHVPAENHVLVMFFANSLPVFFVGQLLEDLPWCIFIANAPAYCSEIVPLRLRAPVAQALQMFWALGSIVVGAVTYKYNSHLGTDAYKYGFVLSYPGLWLIKAGSLSIFNGCSPLPSPSSCSVRQSPWWLVEKDVSTRPHIRLSAWVVGQNL